jgi:formylmethanofuran dehydrogenase subunit E
MPPDDALPAELEERKKFHGHLGPYAVVGYRMGMLACRLLSARGRNMRALARTGLKKPLSCIIDGIQLSSCCTMGKGNISASDEGIPSAVFEAGSKIEITLCASVAREICDGKEHEEVAALRVWHTPDEGLFLVSRK